MLRDGRMFKHENSDLYSQSLNSKISLFECRKRGNPQIVMQTNPLLTPSKPFAAHLPDSNTVFVSTLPSRNKNSLAAIFKITWRNEWNHLGLGPKEIASLLVSSANAPGLGLRPRNLPAAIYWADGIAGVSEEDLRFIGVPVTVL